MDLHPYPVYKDSGVPWLGEVPAHWEIKPLKRWVRINGAVLPENTPPDYEFRYLDIGTVGTGYLTRKPQSIRFGAAPSRARRILRKGDTIISTVRTYLKAVYFIAEETDNLVCSTGFAVLSPHCNTDAKYVSYVVQSDTFTNRVTAHSVGMAYPAITESQLGSFYVAVPPLPEQHAITRFLDHNDRRINRYIRAKRRLIALLNEQKQAIIHRAVTRGLDPHVPLKPSGVEWFSELPEHWQVLPLSRVLAERKEKNNPIKTTNILSLSLSAGVIPYADKKPGGNKAKEDLSAYMLAYPGDIVLNSMNVVVGSVGLSKYFGAVSPVYYVLYPRQAVDSVKYFDAIFQSPIFQRSLFGLGNGIMYIESKSSGKLNTIRLRIPMGKLNRVQIPYPTPDEQVRIVEYLNQATGSFNSAIDRAERQVALIQEYRTRLIADVVTGKLDVRGVALPEEGEADAGELIDEDLDEQGLDGEGEELDAWEDVEDGDD